MGRIQYLAKWYNIQRSKSAHRVKAHRGVWIWSTGRWGIVIFLTWSAKEEGKQKPAGREAVSKTWISRKGTFQAMEIPSKWKGPGAGVTQEARRPVGLSRNTGRMRRRWGQVGIISTRGTYASILSDWGAIGRFAQNEVILGKFFKELLFCCLSKRP